jgi:hypothetical protein
MYEERLLFVAERSIKYRAMPLVMTNQKARGLRSHSHWLLPLTYSIGYNEMPGSNSHES